MTSISLNVNGKSHDLEIEDNTLLVTALREHLGLTGTHVGCDTSQCGCCVVRLNGESVKSCTTLAIQANGGKVLTVEGLSVNGELHPLQKAFKDNHALQCGFCTPGMLMSALDLIESHEQVLTPEVVRHQMEGNLCRCTGYHNIVKAIVQASKDMKSSSLS
ncbi:MAG: (2Fe-2S)-binding protein [Betaproteobacteria bacterium]|jgi:aerobic carbon-monoxide dehydrogenase small subunit